MRRMVRWSALLMLALLPLAGCKSGDITSIRTLQDDPARFDGTVVRIVGDVTRSVGALGYGAYEVDDGTGRLAVVSQDGGAPREGARVGVEGTFRNAFTLGSTTVAAIQEKRRFTAPE